VPVGGPGVGPGIEVGTLVGCEVDTSEVGTGLKVGLLVRDWKGSSEGSGVGASVVGSNVGFLDGWSVVGRLVGGGVLRAALGMGAHVAGTGKPGGRVTGANVMAVDGATVVLFEGGLYGGGTCNSLVLSSSSASGTVVTGVSSMICTSTSFPLLLLFPTTNIVMAIVSPTMSNETKTAREYFL